ncbi:MAG TPA: hypothetical protein DHN33_10995 [Eubacteriaceae bacterium]|nr:hypothetical protein [Eubacteriaceae bacterium]
MKILVNMVSHESKLNWFGNRWSAFQQFIEDNQMDGAELIFHTDYSVEDIPHETAVGMHLKYWPTWVDFWNRDKKRLKDEFFNEENASMYYGGVSPQVLLDQYRKEMDTASKMNVEYMVFHVADVGIKEAIRKEFYHDDRAVMDATIELVNEVFKNNRARGWLLFENLWWPGLNFMNPDATKDFFDRISYQKKGFMLDIGHLMLTNPNIGSLEEAGEYIHQVLDRNKNIIKHIKGIHLNNALDGIAFLKNVEDCEDPLEQCEREKNYWEKLSIAREYISKMDTHIPFEHDVIASVVKRIDPDYLVYEFLPKDRLEWEKMIKKQHFHLGRK